MEPKPNKAFGLPGMPWVCLPDMDPPEYWVILGPISLYLKLCTLLVRDKFQEKVLHKRFYLENV